MKSKLQYKKKLAKMLIFIGVVIEVFVMVLFFDIKSHYRSLSLRQYYETRLTRAMFYGLMGFSFVMGLGFILAGIDKLKKNSQ